MVEQDGPSRQCRSCPVQMSVSIGDQLRLSQQLPYLKSADPMPMLRPSDLVAAGEVGEVVALHPMDTVAVRFRRGTFLIPLDRLDPVDAAEVD